MTTMLSAGLSLKPEYYEEAHACSADGLWFEVHPENYMVGGGPRLAWLETIRARHPLSLHGVALSLAADAEPDPNHLQRLAQLVRRFEPALISEHLAWSTWRGAYHRDLLPFPRTTYALARIAANIGRAQDVLQRPIAIENPSHYLHIEGHEFSEIEFLTELRAAPAAACCSTSTTCTSARTTWGSTRRAISTLFRLRWSPKSIWPDIHRIPNSARRCWSTRTMHRSTPLFGSSTNV